MNNQLQQATTKEFFGRDQVKKKFEELLGKRAPAFITSVLQTVTSSALLAKARPESIYQAAAIAATLDLPINNNLGFAWIVPYKDQAQFQLGAKGFKQLALRTGQYKAINVIPVYANQFKSFNTLTEEMEADFKIEGKGDVIGYAGYMRLVNGFEKTVFWSKEKVLAHGRRFSKSFNSGPWKTDFDKMAQKTVAKAMLSEWGLLSIDMQTALITDQAVIKDAETMDVDYVDVNEEILSAEQAAAEKEHQRIAAFIASATTEAQLNECYNDVPEDLQQAWEDKKAELNNGL